LLCFACVRSPLLYQDITSVSYAAISSGKLGHADAFSTFNFQLID
jgi:hypothetical protein